MNNQGNTLIIGAGISGLMAGKILSQAGFPVTVVEKSRGVGGRMATRRINNGIFDHGAQFFTVREPQFQRWADLWIKEGTARVWTHHFSEPGNIPAGIGHPRYRGANGMTSLAKNISSGLPIHLQTRVISIFLDGEIWITRTDDGKQFISNQLILTAPVPQSLSLLKTGGISLPKSDLARLQAIQYHPCIAVLVLLDGPSGVPSPGGIRFESGPIQWLADNKQKGISSETTAITIHASADFSRKNFDFNPELLAETLIIAAKPWLGKNILDWQLHKWRYSQPMQVYPELFMKIPILPPLFFAGDAFGGPSVEGAALSGMAVGNHLRKQMNQ